MEPCVPIRYSGRYPNAASAEKHAKKTAKMSKQNLQTLLQRLGQTVGIPDLSLEREGKIIEPDEWGGERATTALQGRYDSYVGRDRAYAETLRGHEATDRQNLEDLFTV